MQSKSDIAAYVINQHGPLTTSALADIMGCSHREAGWYAARACSAGTVIRMQRSCRGRPAIYGPAGSQTPGEMIREKIAAIIAISHTMLSAPSIASVIHAKQDTVRSLCLAMEEKREICAVRHGKFTFFCRDLDCHDPVVMRERRGVGVRQPAKKVVQPKPKPPVIKRPPPAPAPAIPVSSASGSVRYGGYIGAAPSRAPWLDFTGWPESSAQLVSRARGGEGLV